MGSQRILLTGATGFIGTQVLRHLTSAGQVHCTSRHLQEATTDVHWHEVDLKDSGACEAVIRKVRPDILVHCAWNTDHGEFWEAKDNVQWLEAGMALFTAFVECGGARIIGCGTCAEYPGDTAQPASEDVAIAPSDPPTLYGRSKLALLHHLQSLDVSHAWARIFLAYGVGEDRRRLVPSICCALQTGREARCSSGRQVRDFMDVRDLGRAIALLAASEVEGPVNLGSGTPASIAEVATRLGELSDRTDLIRLGALPDRPGEPPVLIPDTRKQNGELGFSPAITLEQGLADAAAYWSTLC